jgi:hypothetical protein
VWSFVSGVLTALAILALARGRTISERSAPEVHDRVRYQWSRRAMSHGFPGELYSAIEGHPGVPALEKRFREIGRGIGGDTPAYELTSNLLNDVVGAAYAIDYTVELIEKRAAAAQRWSDQYFTPLMGAVSGGRNYSSSPDVTDTYVEFANLAMWAKALEERLDRPNRAGDGRNLGLLPALSSTHPVRHKVAPLVEKLKSSALDRVRGYANYSTHVSLMPYLGAGARVDDNGRLTFWIPDPLPLDRRVYSMYEFTFDQRLDALTLARDLLASVEEFMDGLLTAFETLEWSQRGGRPT